MASPIKKGRFGGKDLQEFNKLQARLHLEDSFGADSKTLQLAVKYANQLLDLKARLKEQNPEIF